MRPLLSIVCALCASQLFAQFPAKDFLREIGVRNDEENLSVTPVPDAEFSFVRLTYDQNFSSLGRREPWRTDWPEAETHFLKGCLLYTSDAADE